MKKTLIVITVVQFITLVSLQCNAAAQGDAVSQIIVVALGDSITEGYGVPQSSSYPSLLEGKLKSAGRNVKVVNAGTSGSTSASGPSRMRFLLKTKPAWVIIALGGNDGLRGLQPDEMRKNLAQTIKIAKDGGVKVLLAGMKAPPNLGPQYSKNFEAAFKELSKDKNIRFVPFLLDRVAGEAKYNQNDGIHPNEEGHKIIADLIFRSLEKLL